MNILKILKRQRLLCFLSVIGITNFKLFLVLVTIKYKLLWCHCFLFTVLTFSSITSVIIRIKFIWRIVCRIHGLLTISCYMHSSREGVNSLPVECWMSSGDGNSQCSEERDLSSFPHNEMTVPLRRMWWKFHSVECDDSSVLFRRMW